MFTRLLDENQIGAVIEQLKQFKPRSKFEEDNFLEIYAPDGDVVFQVLYTQGPLHVCRFHEEVFDADRI